MQCLFSVMAILVVFSLSAAEVSFEQPVVPSAFIKEININLRVMKSSMKFPKEIYGKLLNIDYPAFIDTIYFLAAKDTSIKKNLEDIVAAKKTTSVSLYLNSLINEIALNANVPRNLLAWATLSMQDKSFVKHLGGFLSYLQKTEENPNFTNRSILLKNAIFFSQFFEFTEMSKALTILLDINNEIEDQLKPGTYTNEDIAHNMFSKFSDQWKRIAQLDVEFAKRIDHNILEKVLAQPKYAKAMISTELTDADRVKIAELELLMKAYKILQDDGYEFYPKFIHLPSSSADQEKKD